MNKKQFAAKYTCFIQLALKLAERARREGLLALEDETEDIDDEFFKKGLRLVVDGTDGGIINEILSARMGHEKDKRSRLLRNIQKRAVLGIQAGENPRIMYEVLSAYAGLTEKEERKILDLLLAEEEEQAEKYSAEIKDDELTEEEIANILDSAIGSDEDGFFRFSDIASLDAPCIQKIMRNVDAQNLAAALKRAKSNVKQAFLDNLTKRAAAMLKEDMDYMGEVRAEDAEEAQQKILEIVRYLSETGEIIVTKPGAAEGE